MKRKTVTPTAPKKAVQTVPEWKGAMKKPSKPPLGEDVWEEISSEQYGAEKVYWEKLKALLVLPDAYIAHYTTGEPIPPKQPNCLYKILGEYACALFDAEYRKYPLDDKLEVWLRNLAARVATSIETTLSSGNLGALTYHATEGGMKAAVSNALESHIRACISKVSNGHAGPGVISTPDNKDRKSLYDSYLASFPAESFFILDVCWAAGQRYSELKRWRRGVAKDGSAPDHCFRALFLSKKSPADYRKEPRPRGWK